MKNATAARERTDGEEQRDIFEETGEDTIAEQVENNKHLAWNDPVRFCYKETPSQRRRSSSASSGAPCHTCKEKELGGNLNCRAYDDYWAGHDDLPDDCTDEDIEDDYARKAGLSAEARSDSKERSCAYDERTKATATCANCGLPLCSSCGYIVGEDRFCNDCYPKMQEAFPGACAECPDYDNMVRKQEDASWEADHSP